MSIRRIPSSVGSGSGGGSVAAPPLSVPASVVTRFAAGHGYTGGTDDAAVALFGNSYRVNTPGDSASHYATGPTIAAQDWSGKAVRVAFRVDNAANVSRLEVYAVTSAGNQFVSTILGNYQSGEWFVCALPLSNFTVAAGVPDWASITQVKLRAVDNGNPLTVWWQAVDLLDDYAALYPSGVFVLTADDGFPGQWANLKPVTDARGIPVTHHIISERYMTGGASGKGVADLLAAQRYSGWEIACHAQQQAVHDWTAAPGAIPAATAEADYLAQKQWLRENGLGAGAADWAMNPGTGTQAITDGGLLDAIRRQFACARSFGGTGSPETIDPPMPHRLRTTSFTGQTNAQLQTNIDHAAGAGGVFLLVVHDVLAGAVNGTSNSLPAIAGANLATILDYAASKGMVFRTVRGWLERR